MKSLMSTRDVAAFLGLNEKMVYSLIAEKGLPATKITGKWLFPRHLIEQWVEANTINYPEPRQVLPPYDGLLIIAGSNDPLLERSIGLFNSRYGDHTAVFGNVGSMGGLRALRRRHCHMASSHLMHDNERDYNFEFASHEFKKMPVLVNFCRREQGLLLPKGNPRGIEAIDDLGRSGITVVNRARSTGTRMLFDRELTRASIDAEKLNGYDREVAKHLDVGIEVLTGRADVGPGIRPVAALLDLDFLPLHWERFDLLITKDRFFDQGVQLFISMLHEPDFKALAAEFVGYDIEAGGKMVFPSEQSAKEAS